MPRDQLGNKILQNKLKKFYALTLGRFLLNFMIKSVWLILNFYDFKIDTNNDGIVNWLDFEAAVEVD